MGTFNCTDGGVNVTDVLNDGASHLHVEGFDSVSGSLALRDSFTVGNGNGAAPVVNAQPCRGHLRAELLLQPERLHHRANSFIWFAVHDDMLGPSPSREPRPADDTCGDRSTTTPVPISFALASGPYTLQRTEEVLYTGAYHEAGNCNATAFDMVGGQQTQLNVAAGRRGRLLLSPSPVPSPPGRRAAVPRRSLCV